jgi:hypothetical protein
MLLLLPLATAAQTKPTLEALQVQVLADGQAASQFALGGEPRFDWPASQQLSAELSFRLAGFSDLRQVEVFAVLFNDRPGQRSKFEAPLVKLRGRHELGAGEQRIAFPELWHCAELPGLRRFRLEVEVALKGAKPLKSSQQFVVEGPALPELEIISFDSWNPGDSRAAAFWQPGELVQLNLLLELRGSQARRGPNLVIYAIMDEDRYLMGVEDEPGSWREARNWDVRRLPSEDGVYQCILQARLPQVFGEPWSSNHPFTIHAVLDSGAGTPVAAKTQGSLVDYRPGEARREPELDFRLIELDPATRWDLRRIRAGV